MSHPSCIDPRPNSGTHTCWPGLVHPGGVAGLAQAHSVEGQDSEGVVDIGGELQVGRGPGAWDLRHVVPVAMMVQGVLVLDDEFCVREVGKGHGEGMKD